jgi:hypothetical protein
MSRKRSIRAIEDRDDSAHAKLDSLIGDAKAKLGLIITPEAADALKADLPNDLDALTDAVLIAGGLDPVYTNDGLRRSLRDLVNARMG